MEQEQKLTSIGIVICYIGKFPEWFPLWVKSCEKNSSIDFLLYTDQQMENLPNNIISHKVTLKELKKRFCKVLGFDCSLEEPYKLCDYKVVYGEAFQEDLRQYKFWGHCDLDMVFGDLRKFITEDILYSFDRIFEVGHLCLYRNCTKVNQLYLRKGALFSYEEVFKEKHYCGFDEHTGITRICEINQIRTYKNVVCADIDPHFRAFYMMDEDTLDGKMDMENHTHQVFTWEDGEAWQIYLDKHGRVQREEVSYIHFMRKHPVIVNDCIGKSKYCITYKEFIPIEFPEKKCIDAEFIKTYSYAVVGISRKMEYLLSFIGNGLKALKRGELVLRIKMRWNRQKLVNKMCIENSREQFELRHK